MAVMFGCFNVIPLKLIILFIAAKSSIIPVTLMSKITFEEYKSAIKIKYQSSKMEDVSGILLNPSPAQLRNLCLIHFDNSLSINDESTMKVFFKVKEGEDLRRAIEKFEIARFRPIISFVTGEQDSDNSARIELAAILVGLEKRPYSKFLKEELVVKPLKFINEDIHESISKDEQLMDTEENVQTFVGDSINTTINGLGRFKIVYVVSFFSILSLLCLFVWNFKNEGDCMVWNKDHYEAVSCDIVSNKMSLISPIVTKKEENIISNFKKIKVCDTTSFFKLGKPCVWYGKSADGNYDCFTAPGLHPETGITLKPITQYMISKHILKKKK